MVTVSYPGVYIQEVPSGVRTITGVSTSIAAFLGRTTKGPINKAVRCLSVADFIREFSGSHPSSNVAASVKQFFDNGGNDCYVIRVAHNAQKASVVLKNLGNPSNPVDAANPSIAVLRARAKNAGNWGNAVYLEVTYNTPNPDETFNLRVIYRVANTEIASESFSNLSMNPASPRFAPNFVTQSSKLIDLELASGLNLATATPAIDGYSESRRPISTAGTDLATTLNELIYPADSANLRSKFEIAVNDGQFIPIDLRTDPTAFSGDRDAIATELETRINALLGAVVAGLQISCSWQLVHDDFYVLRIASNTLPANSRTSVRIRRAATNDLSGSLMLGLDQGGTEVTRYSNFRPVPNATFVTGDINAIASLTQNAFNQLTVSGTSVSLLSTTGANLLQTTSGTDRWYRDALASAVNAHNDGVREKLAIVAQKVNSTPSLPFRAEVWGYHLALIPTTGTINSTLSLTTGNEGGGGTNIGVGGTPNLFTSNTRQYALGTTGTSSYQDGAGDIGRDDDGNPLTKEDFIGNELDQSGFHALDSVDLFNLMVIPEDSDISDSDRQALYGEVSIYCQQKRAFLLMDSPIDWTDGDRPKADSTKVNSLRALVVKDYSAVFYPKIQYSDAGVKKFMGASGLIAGVIARTDATRGVWKAPAGLEADLRGILDLEVNLTDKENGVLNKLGVNCLRKFPSGFVNWGARTLDGSDDIGSEWKYIPIRRLALFLEESLFRGTKWVVFEPNDEPLWAQIRLNINAFMNGLFRQGAFQGSTPDKAYFVKCDSETTTQADRNLGIVNIEVGFAPLKPAEFVIIKIQQIAGDLQ